MPVLADTSVWIEYLRHGTQGTARELDDLLELGQILVCGPVATEILGGTPVARRDELWALLGGLPWVELDRSHWRTAAEIMARLRDQGTPVALTDVVIAVASASAGAQLWSRDADFARIALVYPDLRLRA